MASSSNICVHFIIIIIIIIIILDICNYYFYISKYILFLKCLSKPVLQGDAQCTQWEKIDEMR